MRTFIAVNFSAAEKDGIERIQRALIASSVSGRFPGRDNLHMTLIFLGEIEEEDAERVVKILKNIDLTAFSVSTGDIGTFRGGLYKLGIKAPEILYELQKNLNDALLNEGFSVERRRFIPHITLGREVTLQKGADIDKLNGNIRPLNCKVDRISLMRSDRVKGRVRYTEIFGKEL